MTSREDELPIEIIRIIDGDGFEARVLVRSGRTIEVRLYAIDAPEGGSIRPGDHLVHDSHRSRSQFSKAL